MNITNFILNSELEKDDSMIETRRLKDVVHFIRPILIFVLSRKVGDFNCSFHVGGDF